jgi:hypothetical protein
MKSAAYGILLMLVYCTVHGQGLISMGVTTAGINLHAGYRTPSGINIQTGYSVSMLSSTKPQILDLSVGKIITFNQFELLPSIGIARYKKDAVISNELITNKPTLQSVYGLEISRQVVFGNVHANINYCKGLYAGIGITGFIGDMRNVKKNIWQGSRHWYIPDRREVLSYGIYSFGGINKGIHDAMIYHGWGSGSFAGPDQWKRKYKHWPDDQRAAFPGAKTVFVVFTDATHLTNMLDVASLGAGTMINFANIKEELQQYPKGTRVLSFVTKKIIYPILIRAISFESIWRNLKP